MAAVLLNRSLKQITPIVQAVGPWGRPRARWLQRGLREVIDADLSGYFDTIPHTELMKSLARRISDGALLALLKQWLQMPVEQSDGRGGRRRSNPARRRGRGTPQGAPISPLLANLYMRRFILGWKHLGYERGLQAHIVNYADDFVIVCRWKAQEAYTVMAKLMRVLKLEINQDKTRICRLPADTFDFLGYTFGRCYSKRTGKVYLGMRPSKKKVAAVIGKISHLTNQQSYHSETAVKVEELNALMRGWGNYFCLGPVSTAYRAVDAHACNRLRRWLCKKHKKQGRGFGSYPDEYLYRTLGSNWDQPRRTSRGQKHEITLVRKPDAGNPHVRFDERGCGNGSLWTPRHPSTLPDQKRGCQPGRISIIQARL